MWRMIRNMYKCTQPHDWMGLWAAASLSGRCCQRLLGHMLFDVFTEG
jgi:hypothetical protein